jgi:hypothetical protein
VERKAPCVPEKALDNVISAISVAAEDLDGQVRYFNSRFGGEKFRLEPVDDGIAGCGIRIV